MCGISSLPEVFSHIYVEKRAREYIMTEQVLSHFKGSTVIDIEHYKDVFNRPGQDLYLQNSSKNLIIAVNEGKKIFKGAPVCQDFGFDRFYYAESAMNCIFSCDYCFLKGMYGTSNIVIFVNYVDYLKECEKMLEEGPVYLCASFDTDLAALSGICSWQSIWEDFAASHPEFTLELRTKAAVSRVTSKENIIYAFTVSPEKIIKLYEKNTPTLKTRLNSINNALSQGASVRLCFDPIIYVKDYELCYNEFVDTVLDAVDIKLIRDISIGTFRISSGYLQNIRRACPYSSAVHFPFAKEDGYAVYPKKLRQSMIGILENRLKGAGCESKLYVMP
ncbi:MAG: radical SAM protein [Clostridiales bacterium]|nr:radical SAM protein [Clostridiales bacterium]